MKMTRDFSNNKTLGFIKKYRDRLALIGVVIIFIISIGGGIALQKTRRSGQEFQPELIPKKVELKLQSKKEDVEQTGEATQSASFFLKPSPDELLKQLTSLENLNEDVVESKYTGLRILWPVYFFTLQSTEGNKASLVLDVAEDGFGVLVESEVDTLVYPQLRDLEPGKKLWIGGEILAVDRSGTGTVYLKTEHINLGDKLVLPTTQQKAN
ncbi:MAG: hypothetical protein V2B20_15600 [Pseudomonadota bacterium]